VPPEFLKTVLSVCCIQRDERTVDTFQTPTGLKVNVALLFPETGFLPVGEFFHLTPP
jgi:hypothetical protein